MLATVLAPDAGSLQLLGRDPQRRRRPAGDPAPARLPAAGAGLPPRLHRVRLRRLRGDPQGADRPAGPARRGTPGDRRWSGSPTSPAGGSGRSPAACGGGSAWPRPCSATPSWSILDEPTAGLDPEQRLRFRDLVSRIGEGRTVLLSTHQTEDVAALCPRVVVVDGGRTVFDGTPSALTGTADGRVWLAADRDAGGPAGLAHRGRRRPQHRRRRARRRDHACRRPWRTPTCCSSARPP